ncbi:MAG: hypothetical protein IPG87_03545 [Saprospiraceae bacterium]|nr:hypothetical protein [Candidatus Vicinibacter affinis]
MIHFRFLQKLLSSYFWIRLINRLMLILLNQAIRGYTDFATHIVALVVDFMPRLLGAILAFIIGTILIRWISTVVRRTLMARDFDPSLQSF